MANRLQSFKVDRISLLTNENTPAVQKAGITQAILKFFTGDNKPKTTIAKNEEKTHLDEVLHKFASIYSVEKKTTKIEGIIQVLEKASGWDETDDMFRYRLKEPSLFEQDSFRTVTIQKKPKPEVKSVMGKLKGEDTMTMQNIMFPKDQWTKDEAKNWLKDHKDTLKKMAEEA